MASNRDGTQLSSRRGQLQDIHHASTATFVSDLVHVIQRGPAVNTFHWHNNGSCRGMLETLRALLHSKYGAGHIAEHLECLRTLEQQGNPRVWAFIWIIFATTDAGLQTFLAGVNAEWEPPPSGQVADVERYVGTDGAAKRPMDPWALRNYLADVSDAFRTYIWTGLQASKKHQLYIAITQPWVYGGVAKHARTT